jgi:hypothetical protein
VTWRQTCGLRLPLGGDPVSFEITETFENQGRTYTEIRCTEGVDEPDR